MTKPFVSSTASAVDWGQGIVCQHLSFNPVCNMIEISSSGPRITFRSDGYVVRGEEAPYKPWYFLCYPRNFRDAQFVNGKPHFTLIRATRLLNVGAAEQLYLRWCTRYSEYLEGDTFENELRVGGGSCYAKRGECYLVYRERPAGGWSESIETTVPDLPQNEQFDRRYIQWIHRKYQFENIVRIVGGIMYAAILRNIRPCTNVDRIMQRHVDVKVNDHRYTLRAVASGTTDKPIWIPFHWPGDNVEQINLDGE